MQSPRPFAKVEQNVLRWKTGKLVKIIRVKHLKDRSIRRLGKEKTPSQEIQQA